MRRRGTLREAAVGSGLGKNSEPVRASGGRCERCVAKRRGPVYGWIPPAGGSGVDRGGGRRGVVDPLDGDHVILGDNPTHCCGDF
jgi:hypothetical protein